MGRVGRLTGSTYDLASSYVFASLFLGHFIIIDGAAVRVPSLLTRCCCREEMTAISPVLKRPAFGTLSSVEVHEKARMTGTLQVGTGIRQSDIGRIQVQYSACVFV